MKVTHISTYERSGGAAIAANRLHVGLCAVGVDSQMLVGSQQSRDATVHQVDYLSGPANRVQRQVDRIIQSSEHAQYQSTRRPTLEIFSDDRVPGPERLLKHIPRNAVVNLHWVAGLLDYRRFIADLPADQPLVWTLHDMNPFTGGCHYTFGCGRFEQSCGGCPQLGSFHQADISNRIWSRKIDAFARRRPELTRIVAPSRWLTDEAARSSLFSRFKVELIPYGLDCTIFKPRDRQTARDVFGLSQERPVVMFAADSVGSLRKGFDLLEAAMRIVQAQRSVTFAAIGGRDDVARIDGIDFLGRIDDPKIMSLALSAADMFVLPTRADNLPNVILEAMACGVPIAGFAVGGVPDMVRPGLTGHLARPEDPDSLAQCIIAKLDDPAELTSMRATARTVAVSEYQLSIQAGRYKALYEELLREAHAPLRAR